MSYDATTEKAILKEVARLLATELPNTAIFDYRTVEGSSLAVSLTLSVINTLPGGRTVTGGGGYVEVGIAILAQADPNLEAGERALGEISGKVYQALANTDNHLWMRVIIDRPWPRPANDPELPSIRIAECYFKFLLR